MNDDQNSTNQKGSAGQDPNGAAENGPQRLSDSLEDMQPIAADPVAEAKQEADKFKNEYLYLRAEFENYKKQVIKERSDLRKYGSERLLVDILNVMDIFETALAVETTAENYQTFRKGIEMTANELKNVLGRHGVTEVPSKGQPFDPNVHEALSSEETNDYPNGSISQVYKKPYKLHDRVIRHGQVVVAKPKA